MVHSKTLRRRLIPLVAIALAVLSVSPVLADTEVARTGDVGRFYVWEGVPWQNGVYCRYNMNKHNRLNYIGVSAPGVFARDITGGEDTQTVGWRVIVKRQKPGETALTTFYRSDTQQAVATDVTPTLFVPPASGYERGFNGFRLSVPLEPGEGSRYWIFVRIFWYRADGTVEGSVTHRLDEYMWMLFVKGSGGVADGFYDTSCHTHFVTTPG